MRFALLAVIAATAGCSSIVREESVSPSQVLAGPYELRLAVSPKSVRPGEKVVVSVEIKNTGAGDLWVPRGREIFLGYRQEGAFSASGEFWSSSCDGIHYVRLHRGEKIRYEPAFEVPSIFGTLQIYTTIRRDISVPLVVERWYPRTQEEANQPAEPTSGLHPAAVQL